MRYPPCLERPAAQHRNHRPSQYLQFPMAAAGYNVSDSIGALRASVQCCPPCCGGTSTGLSALPHCVIIVDTVVAWEVTAEAEWIHRATCVLRRGASWHLSVCRKLQPLERAAQRPRHGAVQARRAIRCWKTLCFCQWSHDVHSGEWRSARLPGN